MTSRRYNVVETMLAHNVVNNKTPARSIIGMNFIIMDFIDMLKTGESLTNWALFSVYE